MTKESLIQLIEADRKQTDEDYGGFNEMRAMAYGRCLDIIRQHTARPDVVMQVAVVIENEFIHQRTVDKKHMVDWGLIAAAAIAAMGEVAKAPSDTNGGLPPGRSLGRNQADANRASPASDNRQAFELWARENDYDTEREGDNYLLHETNVAWDGWKGMWESQPMVSLKDCADASYKACVAHYNGQNDPLNNPQAVHVDVAKAVLDRARVAYVE